ncbi:bacterial alpha-L-rhamnosidase-domain-containing protein [Aspergillus cavernicola]|uniref:alpha-L-rhamnosidase n=1 Tax=Aspergillus cavernicola TaxID=176166 RepID=A0ABR4ISZ9_9EURO
MAQKKIALVKLHTFTVQLVVLKTFDLPSEFGLVDRARIYVTGFGVYRAYLNGARVGDHEMAPGWTSYHHRLAYQVFDVSSMIGSENVLGIEVVEGWYAGRLGFDGGKRHLYGPHIGGILQLEIHGVGGQVMRVTSDDSWSWNFSALVRSEIYGGELYDMRSELELGNWYSDPNYKDIEWEPVTSLSFPDSSLIVPRAPPVRVTQRIAPQRILTTPSGQPVLDFDSLTHAEMMEDGELGIRLLRDAQCTDTIISSGKTLVDWSPKFTFHGFRFVQINGWDPREEEKGDTGWIECSHEAINQLHRNAQWSMRGNFVSIPTDCPQRDERLGWTGDIQIFGPSTNFLYRSAGMLADWMEDVAVEQLSHHGAVWDDVVIILPWVLYQSSGDLDILRRQYPSMTAWLNQGVRHGDDNLWDENLWQLGDWRDPNAPSNEPGDGRTNGTLVADAYLVYVTSRLARISDLLGKETEYTHYQHEKIIYSQPSMQNT